MKLNRDILVANIASKLREQTSGPSQAWTLLQNAYTESYLAQAEAPFYFCTQELFGEISKEELSKTLKKLPGELLGSSSIGRGGLLQLRLVEGKENDFMYLNKVSFYKDMTERVSIGFVGIEETNERVLEVLIKAGFRFKVSKDETAGINFGYFSEDYVEMRHKDFPLLALDEIEENYVPEVVAQARELLELLKTEVHGLILLSGPVGTGKTFLIRSLISELTNIRDSVVCTPPLLFLQHPIKLHQGLADFANPFVIFEDLGDVIKGDAKSRYADHFSNLANMTDGLLSILNNSVYLMTFNHQIDDIDLALTREGRCLMQIEVPRLPIEQVRGMVPKDTKLDTQQKDFSLAEVYALKSKGKTRAKAAREIGFLASRRRRQGVSDEDGYGLI